MGINGIETKDWKPVMALPLFKAELKVSDLMREINENSVIKTNPNDGFMSLVFQSDPYVYQANDLFDFSNSNVDVNIQIPSATFPANGRYELKQVVNIPLGSSNDRIYSILLKSGKLISSTNASLNNIEFIISGNSILKNGAPHQFNSSNGNFNSNLSQVNFKINANNELSFELTTQLTGTPGASIAQQSIAFNIELKNIKYHWVKCKINPRQVSDIRDTFSIPMFDSGELNGQIEFFDPLLRFYSRNSFGGDMRLTIEEMAGITPDSSVIPVVFPPNGNQLDVKRPASFGGVAYQKTEIPVSGSIRSLLTSSPNLIYYHNSIYLNPSALPNDTNYVLDTSQTQIIGELELPLQLRFPVLDYEFEKAIDWENMKMEGIEYLKFDMKFHNKFPLELRFQCVFIDDAGQAIDSLFDHGSTLFKSENPNANGRIENISVQEASIVFDKDRSKSLQQASKVRIRLGLNTANKGQEWVRFYEDYRLGMQCKLLAKTSLDASL